MVISSKSEVYTTLQKQTKGPSNGHPGLHLGPGTWGTGSSSELGMFAGELKLLCQGGAGCPGLDALGVRRSCGAETGRTVTDLCSAPAQSQA